MKKSQVQQQGVPDLKARADYEVFKNGQLTREQIAEWLQKDIQGIYVLLSEILGTPEILDAIVNVFYSRYTDIHRAPVETPLDQPQPQE